ncbi:DUF2627 domain-containing protein [Sporosarcina sp. G11-34]|uniref:DUF2627 domain-containing protein n=1 Tax=Sporosarcina sp. G11-34 TaxID=2849605 RepID=UPI0022A9DF63|nr:DUF2627 domain-containing protein [Sporosarcina sp. G11-34]MCZ2260122.1 DUF2627 domain-containing protein [Sporosarcina sp. G11-34]
MARLAAFIVLLIPGLIAAGGIKIMRDSLFGLSIFTSNQTEQASSTAPFLPIWLQFLLGLLMFGAGLWFFAGFLLHRDRKNGRVQKKFAQKKRL